MQVERRMQKKVDRKKTKEHGQMENSDGEEEQQTWICRGSSGEEPRFVEAGDPYRILKAEFYWLDDLFVGARVRCKDREQLGDENDSREKEKWYHYGQDRSCP